MELQNLAFYSDINEIIHAINKDTNAVEYIIQGGSYHG
ncbi:hypothetical protein E6C60_0067 [Paenibacillus algicola]|uniref:Uncharacterized protein n=1 Tax=Paenibacillus algicola TaxID=2565926 RepID=A0A4P8XEQ2_9BACL|nr:hypothetical protein E6C60_0067 [Paenibacillus algicola]